MSCVCPNQMEVFNKLRITDFGQLQICLFGGPNQDRTGDLIVANDALSQLSYWPNVILLNNIMFNYSINFAHSRRF